jgi:hypothetical protein
MKFLLSKTIATALLATGVAVGGMVAPASAKKPDHAGGGGGGGGGQTGTTCNVLDVTGAIDCYGSVEGNDKKNDVIDLFKTETEITNDIGGVFNWDLEQKSDEGAQNYFSVANGSNAGTITILQDIDFTFALNLKASNIWSAYFFDGAKAGDTIDYVTDGVAENGNGSAAALSHASLFISDNAVSSTPDTPDPQEVPEPASILGLLAIGAMGTGSLLKRQQR